MTARVNTERQGGSVYYSIHGTLEEVTEAVNAELRRWPVPGYGTWFNWPPNSKTSYDGKSIVTYLAATKKEDGTWIGRGHRSTSCD